MSKETVVRVELPLAATAKPAVVVDTCTKQSSVLKQAPAYATTPTVQTAVAEMDTAVGNLSGTVTKIEQARAELSTLETTRAQQIAIVFLKHDGVEASINVASNGDPA